MGGGCKRRRRQRHIQGGGNPSLHLGMCGLQGRRCGWGPGRVDCGGGWLAARSTGGGEWSVQGGVSAMRGRTPVRPHAAPPSPCPDHPSRPVATRETVGEWKRVQPPAVCSNIVQTGFQTQPSLCPLSLNTALNLCKIIANQRTDKTVPKSAHNPQSLLRVGRLFQPTTGRKSAHNPLKPLTIEELLFANNFGTLIYICCFFWLASLLNCFSTRNAHI